MELTRFYTAMVLLIITTVIALKIPGEWLTMPLLRRSVPEHRRVAICIAGTARTFEFGGVYKQIQESVIQPIKDANYETDVYFVIRMDDDPTEGREYVNTTTKGIWNAMRSFNPVNIKVCGDQLESFNMSRYIPGGTTFIQAPWSCGPKRPLAFPFVLFRTKQCLQEIESYERRKRFQYDWIYRTRSDLILLENITTPDTLKRDVLYVNSWAHLFSKEFPKWWRGLHGDDVHVGSDALGDSMFAASRQMAGRAFKAFDAYNMESNCVMYDQPDNNVENALRYILITNNITYETVNWIWTVVRANGPTIGHWRFMDVENDGKNVTMDQRMHMCNVYKDRWRDELPGGDQPHCAQ